MSIISLTLITNMRKSTTPIIKHISDFLDYCKFEKKLSENTQENYKRYLSKFIFWLNKKNKQNIKPHDLTSSDIKDYTLFLSKDKNLKKITQNYYLIALRAFLSYFSSRDIQSLPVDKIILKKSPKRLKARIPLKLAEIIKGFLSLPSFNKIGLRDRAILSTLVSTDLKVSQLANLNRDTIKEKILSKNAFLNIEKYLKTRNDNHPSLFINYRSHVKADKRLTTRSIQRIVKQYEKNIKLPYPITPEVLRWSYINAVINEHTKPRPIFQNLTHYSYSVKRYNYIPINNAQQKNSQKSSLKWHIVEPLINKEINWLKEVILIPPEKYRDKEPEKYRDKEPLNNSESLRNIAIGIVNGQFKVTEFCAKDKKSLWDNLISKTNFKKISFHGKEWHRSMMTIINEYFKRQNCEVNIEPILNYGRADLGVYPTSNNPFYIEVGTVSLFKLWYNLLTMKNVVFLIVPSEDYLIEFRN